MCKAYRIFLFGHVKRVDIVFFHYLLVFSIFLIWGQVKLFEGKWVRAIKVSHFKQVLQMKHILVKYINTKSSGLNNNILKQMLKISIF